MATRKQRNVERKRKTRQTLLQAATIVFNRSGYHATLISDIVAEAGVGQGTFYRYFESKREIIDALFDHFITSLFEGFAPLELQLPSDEDSYRDASVRALIQVSSIIERNKDITFLFLQVGPSIDKEFAEKLAAVQDQLAAIAQFYLDHAIASGFARPCNSEVVAQSLVGVGIRLFHLWFSGRLPGIPLPKLIEEVVDFAFKGFGSNRQSQ
ncbi:TetR/AcrR family transcriptional regulator [candidate division CSSED10-310 bacterium]|uniref:TetR/AcrR family transcriptional regulator n=1 Tax=candidate division CSSED10-310 bacterium TaxID=2855610 RepID=A0ABV6YVF9_UNCC1